LNFKIFIIFEACNEVEDFDELGDLGGSDGFIRVNFDETGSIYILDESVGSDSIGDFDGVEILDIFNELDWSILSVFKTGFDFFSVKCKKDII